MYICKADQKLSCIILQFDYVLSVSISFKYIFAADNVYMCTYL